VIVVLKTHRLTKHFSRIKEVNRSDITNKKGEVLGLSGLWIQVFISIVFAFIEGKICNDSPGCTQYFRQKLLIVLVVFITAESISIVYLNFIDEMIPSTLLSNS
jgi:hypothetical protein